MAPASISGSASPPTACESAAPVNCETVAVVIVLFELTLVAEVVTWFAGLELEVVVVPEGEVTAADELVAAATATEERPVTP